jgi:hypothetical protein
MYINLNDGYKGIKITSFEDILVIEFDPSNTFPHSVFVNICADSYFTKINAITRLQSQHEQAN